MRVVCQRVSQASVSVDGEIVGQIQKGLLLLVGIGPNDTENLVRAMASKVSGLRIFADDQDRMNLSVVDANGACLVVSQFTLYGDCKKGRRPSLAEQRIPNSPTHSVMFSLMNYQRPSHR